MIKIVVTINQDLVGLLNDRREILSMPRDERGADVNIYLDAVEKKLAEVLIGALEDELCPF